MLVPPFLPQNKMWNGITLQSQRIMSQSHPQSMKLWERDVWDSKRLITVGLMRKGRKQEMPLTMFTCSRNCVMHFVTSA